MPARIIQFIAFVPVGASLRPCLALDQPFDPLHSMCELSIANEPCTSVHTFSQDLHLQAGTRSAGGE